MNWFINSFNCTSQCSLQCCEQNLLNWSDSIEFWSNIQKVKSSEHEEMRLLREKHIYLDDSNEFVLVLGINPKAEFKISSRLEVKSKQDIFVMDSRQLMKLLDCLSRHFSTSSIYPQSINPDNATFQLLPTYHKMFNLRLDGQKVYINEQSLHNLFIAKSRIRMYILMLEYERKPLETHLFNLLNHFSYNKSLSNINMIEHPNQIQTFFDEIINIHCDCIDKSFIIEIATNFPLWFNKCITIFCTLQILMK